MRFVGSLTIALAVTTALFWSLSVAIAPGVVDVESICVQAPMPTATTENESEVVVEPVGVLRARSIPKRNVVVDTTPYIVPWINSRSLEPFDLLPPPIEIPGSKTRRPVEPPGDYWLRDETGRSS